MGKFLSLFFLTTVVSIANASSVFGFTISPEQDRIVFQDIKYLNTSAITRPAQGYFRINNIKPYINLFAYSGSYDGTIKLIKYPMVSVPNYPIKISVSSDAVQICSFQPYQCSQHITTSFDKSNTFTFSLADLTVFENSNSFTIKLTDRTVEVFRKGSGEITNFHVLVSVGGEDIDIHAAVNHFDKQDRGTPMPYDYFNFPSPWNLVTAENIIKVIFFIIIIPVFLTSLNIYRHKNRSTRLLLFIKFLILILALFLSTVILTRSPDSHPSYNCSWDGYYDSHGKQGLPIFYNYPSNDSNFILTVISINYWFWIFSLMVIIAFINKDYLENNVFSLKKFIKQNKYFLLAAIICYALINVTGEFLGITLMC